MFDLKILPRIYFTLIDLLLIFLDGQCWGGWGGEGGGCHEIDHIYKCHKSMIT